MTTIREEIRNNYPEILSLENIRCILRISKRKASWMLQNGIIKCENNGKKTRQYKVTLDDLFEYLDRLEQANPSVALPVGRFTSRKQNSESKEMSQMHSVMYNKPPEDFRLWLEDEWFAESDLLFSNDVSRITGYTKTTVNRWMEKKTLRTVQTQCGVITTKTWLVDFYCEHAYGIVMKSDAHIELPTRYYAEK